MLRQYQPTETHLFAQAAARDPSCIPILLESAALIERVDRSDTLVFYKQLHVLQTILWSLGFMLEDESTIRLVAAAVADAEPAVLDALGDWLTCKYAAPLRGVVSPEVQATMQSSSVVAIATMVCAAALPSPHAAAAIAKQPKLVRALVTAADRVALQQDKLPLWECMIPAVAVLLQQAPEDVMRAIRGQPGGASEDRKDLKGQLREQVAAVVAAGKVGRETLSAGESILAALEAAKQQQQQQQPLDSSGQACAGCSKRSGDEGVVKLRHCGGCPRATALRFCGVECELSLLWVWAWVGFRGLVGCFVALPCIMPHPPNTQHKPLTTHAQAKQQSGWEGTRMRVNAWTHQAQHCSSRTLQRRSGVL